MIHISFHKVRSSEGVAEGGCGGNSAAPEQKRVARRPRVLARSRAEKLSFPFRRKNWSRAKSEMSRKFFCEAGRRFAAVGGGLPLVMNF